MTINLELSPEEEASLTAAARAKGMSLEAYVKLLIERSSSLPADRPAQQDEFRAALDALSALSDRIPSFSDKTFLTRENIYQDHD